MKRILFITICCLALIISVMAQAQKVKRSGIIENLKGQDYYIHFVGSGETLQAIAEAYHVTAAEITRLNPEIANGLKANQVLKITKSADIPDEAIVETENEKPAGEVVKTKTGAGKIHVIEPKETWYGISRYYQIPIKDLLAANPGVDTLRIGMKLNIPEVAANEPIVDKASDNQHTVLAQETLYSISKKYNITIEDLQLANPGLTEGLKIGQVLNIPDKQAVKIEKQEFKPEPQEIKPEPRVILTETKVTEQPQEQKNYKEHIVQRKETLYGISKQYGVSLDAIIKINPGFDGKLRKNDILRIPLPTPVIVEEKIIPSSVKEIEANPVVENKTAVPCALSPSKKLFNVAILIPFRLEDADSISTGDPASLQLPSEYRSLDFIQFYEGALLAVDSLSRAGMNVKIHVFDADAGDNTSKTRRILANAEISQADLIIGPFFAKSFELVAEFAASHSIPVVNPLSQRSEILDENPYVFKVQPSAWSQYNKTARYIADNFSGANLIILRRNAEENKSMASSLKSAIEKHSNGSIKVTEVVYSQSQDAGLFNNMVAGKKNVVMMLTSDKALLPALLRRMSDAGEKYKMTLFGLPEWEYLELDSHYVLDLNTHLFNPWFVNYSDKTVKSFIETFKEQYKAEPELDKMAYLGYDISFYFLNNLYNYGNGFTKCLSSINHHGLSTAFSFWKTENGGYENTATTVYMLKDYKRVMVNRE